MRSPADIIDGYVSDYDEKRGELVIRAPYSDVQMLLKRRYRKCKVQLLDDRPLSSKQRNACYKLLREISNYTGMGLDPTKDVLKKKFIEEELCADIDADQDFSLGDAPMSVVCAFERYLVRFLLDYDIPTSFPLLTFVDDVGDYLYWCIATRHCCVCGKHADLHHDDAVGMGRNRDEIIHEGMEALPLCREHHTEAHKIGKKTFKEKYHIPHGVILDAHLCDLLGLRKET